MKGNEIYISTDKKKLDIDFIHTYLSVVSYWAKGRTKEEVMISIENSLCFGVYRHDGKQLGFARVVTDKVAFAWVMDVFVSPEVQRQGIGKMLVKHILDHESLQLVKGIGLRTEDAHGLYRQFGFDGIPKVHTWMFKPIKTSN